MWLAVATLWFCSATAGLWVLWACENQPGASAQALSQWPADTGLAHERGFAEGWEKWVESRPGEGSRFTFRLPAAVLDTVACAGMEAGVEAT